MAETHDRDACLAAGANAYLSKPVDIEHLRETLASLCAAGSA